MQEKSSLASHRNHGLNLLLHLRNRVQDSLLPLLWTQAMYTVLQYFNTLSLSSVVLNINLVSTETFKSLQLPAWTLNRVLSQQAGEWAENAVACLEWCVGVPGANVPCTGCFLKVSDARGMVE